MKKMDSLITQRRDFFKGVVAATTAVAVPWQLTACAQTPTASSAVTLPSTTLTGAALAKDVAYWDAVRSLYTVDTPKMINLENGYWGIMANPVKTEFMANIERVNRENTVYARQNWAKDFESIRQQVALAAGASTDEIAFTRNATEAMQLLITNYNKLKAGDTARQTHLKNDSNQPLVSMVK